MDIEITIANYEERIVNLQIRKNDLEQSYNSKNMVVKCEINIVRAEMALIKEFISSLELIKQGKEDGISKTNSN